MAGATHRCWGVCQPRPTWHHVNLSIYLLNYPTNCLSIYSSIELSVHKSICLSTYASNYLSTVLANHPGIPPSINPSHGRCHSSMLGGLMASRALFRIAQRRGWLKCPPAPVCVCVRVCVKKRARSRPRSRAPRPPPAAPGPCEGKPRQNKP